MAQREWNAVGQAGYFNGGASTVTCNLPDGYTITITLEQNADGLLVAKGMSLKPTAGREPSNNISSKYFQTLGFGELLSEARKAYVEYANIVEDVYLKMLVEKLLADWPNTGAAKFPDAKYAAVAWKYENLLLNGSSNPVIDLAEIMGCEDRDTASVRIIEARSRGLLSRPTMGSFGGKLTARGRKILEMEGGDKNAKKSKPSTRSVEKK